MHLKLCCYCYKSHVLRFVLISWVSCIIERHHFSLPLQGTLTERLSCNSPFSYNVSVVKNLNHKMCPFQDTCTASVCQLQRTSSVQCLNGKASFPKVSAAGHRTIHYVICKAPQHINLSLAWCLNYTFPLQDTLTAQYFLQPGAE